MPVMVALHGGGGNANQFKKEIKLDKLADKEHFIAVYPNGTGPYKEKFLTWNAGEHCCGWASDNNIDDVGFLSAVLDDLEHKTKVDGKRIYVTGHSNGAIMAYRFAAEQAERVAAVVPVAGALDLPVINPVKPVPLLHIHSQDDPRALYTGGLGPPFPGTERRTLHASVREGIDRWARRSGCKPNPVERESERNSQRYPEQTLTRWIWQDCLPGGDVEHVLLTGVGHGWPGVRVRFSLQRLIGRDTKLLNATEAAWYFASQFSR
jgi:polyhydroxybutyrate depolymerase